MSIGAFPFDGEDSRSLVEIDDWEGRTVCDIIGPLPDVEKHIILVAHRGELIDDWSYIVDSADVPLFINIVPKSRNILAIAGLVAVAVIAPAAAGAILGPGASTFALSAVTGAISLIGNAIVTKLTAPDPPGFSSQQGSRGYTQDAQRFGIRSTQNRQAERRTPVLCVMGKFRVVPYLATKPYVYAIDSSTMGYRGLYDFGIGPLEFEAGSHKFGDTLVSTFENAAVRTHDGDPAQSSGIDAFPYVHEQEQVDYQLTKENGFGVFRYPKNTREVVLLIAFSGLFQVNDQGDKVNRTVTFTVGKNDSPGTGFSTVTAVRTTAKTTSLHLVEVRVPISQRTSAGEVRIRRDTNDTDNSRIRDVATLRYVDSIKDVAPVAVKGRALAYIQIEADRNLNNVVSTYSAVVTRKIPTWTKASGWGSRVGGAPASNPGWLIADLMRGPGLFHPLEDDSVDAGALKEFADYCTTRGYSFNAVFNTSAGLWDRMNAVAAAGRATITLVDGTKYGVVIDRKKTVPVDLITPRDAIRMTAGREFDRVPHAFRATFADSTNSYMESEIIVYAPKFDGTTDIHDASTATDIRAINLTPAGVTTAAEAHKYLRYLLAVKVLRPEAFRVVQDIKSLRLQRGDPVDLQYDTILVGLGSARLREVKVDNGRITQMSLDETIELNVTGQSKYSARFQTLAGDEVTVGIRRNDERTVAQESISASVQGSYV